MHMAEYNPLLTGTFTGQVLCSILSCVKFNWFNLYLSYQGCLVLVERTLIQQWLFKKKFILRSLVFISLPREAGFKKSRWYSDQLLWTDLKINLQYLRFVRSLLLATSTMEPQHASAAGHSSGDLFRTTLQPSMSAWDTACARWPSRPGKTVNTAGEQGLGQGRRFYPILNQAF